MYKPINWGNLIMCYGVVLVIIGCLLVALG